MVVARAADEAQVRTVKLSTVINQMLDNEVAIRSANTTQYRLNWEIVHGKNSKPMKLKKPNDIQMCCFEHVLGSGGVPYADLSIWGPNQQRTAKRLRFRHVIHSPDGTWRYEEMFGPQDVTTWELGYGLWWTACICKVIIENGTLAEYCDKIRAAEREYGFNLLFPLHLD